jgi:hypothetical protein
MSASANDPGAGPPASEKRKSTRHRALKAGRVVYGNLSMTLDVIIRDMSEGGARLKVDANANMPGEFYFVVVADQLVAKSRVVWRSAREVGIEYLEPMRNLKEHPDPRVARMIVA